MNAVADVLAGRAGWACDPADALAFLRGLPADAADLVFTSPPYLMARTYGIAAGRGLDEWVAWMTDVVVECARVCRGLVAVVCEGQPRPGARRDNVPARLLREGILDSEAVNALSFAAEVFYRRLMSVVDDFGRFDGRVPILRSRLYGLRLNDVSDDDVNLWLAECEAQGLVAVYLVAGKPYIQFAKLGPPRAKESRYPPPPATPGPRSGESRWAAGGGLLDDRPVVSVSPPPACRPAPSPADQSPQSVTPDRVTATDCVAEPHPPPPDESGCAQVLSDAPYSDSDSDSGAGSCATRGSTHEPTSKLSSSDEDDPGAVFRRLWAARHGAEFAWRPARHAGVLRAVFDRCGRDPPRFAAVLGRFFADPDPFLAANGHPVGLLSSQLAKWLDPVGPAAPGRRKRSAAEIAADAERKYQKPRAES